MSSTCRQLSGPALRDYRLSIGTPQLPSQRATFFLLAQFSFSVSPFSLSCQHRLPASRPNNFMSHCSLLLWRLVTVTSLALILVSRWADDTKVHSLAQLTQKSPFCPNCHKSTHFVPIIGVKPRTLVRVCVTAAAANPPCCCGTRTELTKLN